MSGWVKDTTSLSLFSDRCSKGKLETASKAQLEWLHEHETGALKTMAEDCSTGVC